MKTTLIGVIVLSAAFAARPSQAASIENYIPREEAKRVAALLTRQLLSTEVDAYRPKGFAKELPEIVCYPEGRPGQFIHYSVVTLWANALMCARWAGEKEMEDALAAKLEPFYGPKSGELPKFKHVDYTVVGAVPLTVAALTGDPRALELGLRYADMQWEKPREDDPPPPYNAESMAMRMEWWNMGYTDQTRLWIDDAYMISLLQIQAYLATGKYVYLDRAARETALFLDRLQLENGLFNHAYRVPFRWARGNGWMAAAMANILLHLPRRDEFIRAHVMNGYRRMMETLLLNQREDGLWGQLVDDAGSWTESSGSAMFTYALATGVRSGWLDEKRFGPAVAKAWKGLCARIDADGNLARTCIGTAARADRQWYLDRPCANGDPHGQAAMLWVCGAVLMGDEPLKIRLKEEWEDLPHACPVLLNAKDDGFRGIWYYNQRIKGKYNFKYSGGLATAFEGYVPMAVYAPQVDRTFFCWGGTDELNTTLYHCVSYYDHKTGLVARPTIVLDKRSIDAHDNPVINIDAEGYVYVFSPSHGKTRPSCVSRSVRPYDISHFEIVWTGNFSYTQPWFVKDRGCLLINTIYNTDGEWQRLNYVSTSGDGGRTWTKNEKFVFIEDGDYLRSWQSPSGKIGVAFDRHPGDRRPKALNYRTDVYYLESDDFGATWKTAAGTPVALPVETRENPALVFRYGDKGLNAYIKGVRFDSAGRPLVLYIVSKGYEAGPENGPRTWHVARWTGSEWRDIDTGIVSGNNYDFGVLYVDSDTDWTLLGATELGPQAYNPGGELAAWRTRDAGATWHKERQLTANSARNHNYARQPLGAKRDFCAFWFDGDGLKPSISRMYFCDRDFNVYRLPLRFEGDFAKPEPLPR